MSAKSTASDKPASEEEKVGNVTVKSNMVQQQQPQSGMKSAFASMFGGRNSEDLDNDDELMAERTGYKSEMAREFRSLSTISFAFSIMGLISSVATTLNAPLTLGGPASTVWAWFMGSIFNMTLGTAIGEIVSAYPSSGGLYSASGLLVPRKYRAITAWIAGWLNFTGQIAGIAGTEYGLAQMIFAWAFVLTGYVASTAAIYGLYAGLLIIHGVLNCFPTGWLARFTSSYVFVNLGMTVLTGILILCRTPSAEMQPASYVFGEVIDGTGYNSKALAFFLSLLSVQFVMTDYDATAHISEEVSRAAIAAPVAIIVAVAGTGIFGFFLNIALVYASGDVLTTTTIADWPGGLIFAQIVLQRAGRVAFLIIWPFICSVAFFVVQTATQANARSFYAFSRDGGLPDRGFFARVEKRTKTTINAVWLVIALCLLLGLLSFASYAAVAAIFSLAALGMDLSYIIPIISAMIFRNHPEVRFKRGPFYLGDGWFGTFIRVTAVLWTLFECTVLAIPTTRPLTALSMNWSSIVMFGVLIITGIYYAIWGRKFYHGPREGSTVVEHPPAYQGTEEEKKVTA